MRYISRYYYFYFYFLSFHHNDLTDDVLLAIVHKIVKVATGREHSLALTDTGLILHGGASELGQAGNGAEGEGVNFLDFAKVELPADNGNPNSP